MTPARRTLAFIAACSLMAVPLRAPAFDQPGCGHAWKSTDSLTLRTCGFFFGGLPLTILADAQATSGASVHAWITLDGYDQVVVLECSDTGTTYATCDNDVSNETLNRNLPPQAPTARLVCHVEGKGAGDYFCSSGRN